jgi:hypothetical protein
MLHKIIVLGIIMLTGYLTGCQRNPYDTVMVTGVVRVDGKPTDKVTVSFQPVNSTEIGAIGMTDVNGTFVLTTNNALFGSGAIPGTYNVTFIKSVPNGEYHAETPEEFRQKFGDIEIPLIFIVPKKYGNIKTSGIAPVTVEKRGKNFFEFDLPTKGI